MAGPRDIIIRPVVTEKSNDAMAAGKYTFLVDPRANRTQIKLAIEEIFKVKVMRVNTVHGLGKLRRVGTHEGRRPSWKKAVATLAPGQKIQIFE